MWHVDPAQCALKTLVEQPLHAFLPMRGPGGSGGMTLVLIAGIAYWFLARHERRREWPWCLAAVVPALVVPYPRIGIPVWSAALFFAMWYMNIRERRF